MMLNRSRWQRGDDDVAAERETARAHDLAGATTTRAFAMFRQFACARDEQLDFEYYDMKLINNGEPQDLALGACAWEISITSPGVAVASRTVVDPMEFTLRLTQL